MGVVAGGVVVSGATSLGRLQATLAGREPDRVPLFLLLTTHGARELGLGIREYFADARNVVEAQLRMRARFGHDCLTAFFHAAGELEAFRGEVIWREDGPPNAGAPVVRGEQDVAALVAPRVADVPGLVRVLEAIRALRERAGPGVPIVAAAVAPFSLPAMQLGLERYLEWLHERPDLVDRLLAVNEEFAVEWANAQLAAGATLVGLFDPLSSPTLVPPAVFRARGLAPMSRAIGRIAGPVATLLGSGRCLAALDDLAATGTLALGVGDLEDLAAVRAAAGNRLTLIGNLNGIAMRRWGAAEAEAAVKDVLRRAGRGGRFVLADAHGDIPFQVPEAVLEAIGRAVERWGRYPLEWAEPA